MPICVYGEIGFDWLIQPNKTSISYRLGGAGLYASLAAAKQGDKVELFTVYGREINQYCLSSWDSLGISFDLAKFEPAYSLPKYIVTGYQQFGHKVSRPLTEVKLDFDYNPSLPKNCSALLVFPVNHSLPKELCKIAHENNIPIFLDPKPNESSIIDAREILSLVEILLVNEEEIKKLSGMNSLSQAVQWVKSFGVTKIVVKKGIHGSVVFDEESVYTVQTYKSDVICTLGSGDVFAGALIPTYLRTLNLRYSVELATCVAANFIEHIQPESVLSRAAVEQDMKVRPKIKIPEIKEKILYIAGPFFSEQEKEWVDRVCFYLIEAGFKILSPSEENGIIKNNCSVEERRKIFDADIKLLEQADIIVALLDHNDAGTNFEIGYAYKKGVPVLGLKTSEECLNNMIVFGCDKVTTSINELIGELYEYCKS